MHVRPNIIALLAFAVLSFLTACTLKTREAVPPSAAGAGAESTARKPAEPLTFLHTRDLDIVNEKGDVVLLRGCNIGGWLHIEPWIPGLDNQGIGTEKELWDLMANRFGNTAKLDLIKTYRETFFNEGDVRRIADLGLNCIRVPVWWRSVSDPNYGGEIAYLDRCIEWCSKNGVYVIIDLQGAPGGQSANAGEPSKADLWKSQVYKDQTIGWWKSIAQRYKEQPAVAGYDLLNEGTETPAIDDLVSLYDALYKEIRKIDPRHIIVMEHIWGFHQLPRSQDLGWFNVVYSFHFYPQTSDEGMQAGARTWHKFNRTALYYGVPTYVGEFNTIQADRGGADQFMRWREICEYYGWSWTFWTYKKAEDNYRINWGLYGGCDRKSAPDLNHDPLEKIKAGFEQLDTARSKINPLLRAALVEPRRWQETSQPAVPGAQVFTLRDAFIVPAEKGSALAEWGYDMPNVGYWGRGDRVIWQVDVRTGGTYVVGIRMANDSDTNAVTVRVDGVHAFDVPVQRTGGWRDYQDRSLGRLELDRGIHRIELGEADHDKQFINLQSLWLKPSTAAGQSPDENDIHLDPFTAQPFAAKSPLRIEWLDDPPDVGSWKSGESVSWRCVLKEGGHYQVGISYGTPNSDTTVTLIINGMPVATKPLQATGSWKSYAHDVLGVADLGPGEHVIGIKWNVAHSSAVGNLQSVDLTRIPVPK